MKNLIRTAAFLLIAIFSTNEANACTGLRLTAKDGSVIFARTMEWGTFDLNSRVVVVPRNFALQDKGPNGENILGWKTKYGAVGIDALHKDVLIDGMNEKGLTVNAFYHEGYAVYTTFDAKKAGSSISVLGFAPYILTNCASVAEVKETMRKINVVAVIEPALGIVPPLHFGVTDSKGNSIVIEFINGVAVIHDAPLGVVTNGPTYDWHMENFLNYVELDTPLSHRKIEKLSDVKFGGGNKYFGLPGDLTSPSRLLRVAANASLARSTPDGKETMYEAFRILDNFNLPVGKAAEGGGVIDNANLRSATLWTTCYDTNNKVMYYHTLNNRRVRQLNFKELNFDAKSIVRLPLDVKKEQDIDDITHKLL